MSGSITGIIIQKNNFAENIPLEECEKKEGTCIVRFQRPAAANPIESFIRFFSDIRDGVTKTKGALTLFGKDGKLPRLINVKEYVVVIKEINADSAQGILTGYGKDLPGKGSMISIVFKPPIDEHLGANKNTGHTNEASAPPALGKKIAPVPPPIGNRPSLSTAQQLPNGNQAPQPPSREGRPALTSTEESFSLPAQESIRLPSPPPRLTSEQLTAFEQNLAPQKTRPPLTLPPEDNPPPLPPGFQSPAETDISLQPSAAPPAPPPPELSGLNSASAKPLNSAQVTSQTNLQPKQEAAKPEDLHNQIRGGVTLKKTDKNAVRSGEENSAEPTLLGQIKKGALLRKTETSTRPVPETAPVSNAGYLFNTEMLDKFKKRREGIEGDGPKKVDDDDW